jgi:tripartite ATP-independent transporter DctM subunit
MDLMILASLAIFTLLIFTGVPIPFGFLAATIFLTITKGIDPSFLLPVGFAKMNSVTLLSLPFFITTGYLVTGGSIAGRLIEFVRVFVGRMTGGLGVVAVIVSCVFGAISGAAASSVIAVGTIMIPQMEKHGYPRGYSAALISSAAVLSTMIPPSLAMIMYAFVTGQSVAACFLATIGPAILLATLFCFINVFMVRKMPSVEVPQRRPFKEQVTLAKQKSKAAFGAILMPIMILGGIYGGIMTPTEAAASAVFYSIILGGFIYREMKLNKTMFLLRSSAVATGTMVLMTFFAAILSRIYTMEQVPQQIAEMLLGITSNKLLLLLLINLFLIAVGMIMDELSGILIVVPLLYPVILKLGIDPIHFAAILGTNLGMGMMTPPMAGILYIGARTGNVTIDKMMRPALMLILFGSIPTILITTFWEPLSIYLPTLAGYIH